jgi:hypothetical protein
MRRQKTQILPFVAGDEPFLQTVVTGGFTVRVRGDDRMLKQQRAARVSWLRNRALSLMFVPPHR